MSSEVLKEKSSYFSKMEEYFPKSLKYCKNICVKKVSTTLIQRILLVGSVVCAVVSLIPGVGMYGSLALRSVSIITAGITCVDAYRKEGGSGLLMQSLRVILVIQNFLGVMLGKPAIVLTAIIGGMAIQAMSILHALYRKKIMVAGNQLALTLVSALAVAAYVTGSWQCVIAAYSGSAAIMVYMAVKTAIRAYRKKTAGLIFEATCYSILCELGFLGIFSNLDSKKTKQEEVADV